MEGWNHRKIGGGSLLSTEQVVTGSFRVSFCIQLFRDFPRFCGHPTPKTSLKQVPTHTSGRPSWSYVTAYTSYFHSNRLNIHRSSPLLWNHPQASRMTQRATKHGHVLHDTNFHRRNRYVQAIPRFFPLREFNPPQAHEGWIPHSHQICCSGRG